MNLVLASKSPRRHELLKKLGLPFRVEESHLDENMQNFDSVPSLVMSLAFQKAYDVSQRLDSDKLVIGADTVVYKDKILGKPQDEQEAYNMLRRLSGNIHTVYTGFSIVNSKYKIIDYSKTKVCFKNLTDDMIYEYIKTGEPFDKAGGYGIQSEGSKFIDYIDGDFDNVVGLPVDKLMYWINKYK